MTNKHTPGPWALSSHENFNSSSIATIYNVPESAGYGKFVYITAKTKHSTYEEWAKINLANAQLIAAAPELLKTLKTLCKHLKVDSENDEYRGSAYLWLDDAEKAINKAMGK